jgi:hypothetical protein
MPGYGSFAPFSTDPLEKNREILGELREHMRANRLLPDRVPLVLQLNKTSVATGAVLDWTQGALSGALGGRCRSAALAAPPSPASSSRRFARPRLVAAGAGCRFATGRGRTFSG